ncbi:hypothetical protein ACINB_01350 [Acidovorax sp. NB1]|nr:hypothetical protein ACINB_01350 [Acidovorax sp. NB1]
MRVKEILRSGEWVAEIAGKTGPNAALARPHGVNLGRSTENCRKLVQRVHAYTPNARVFCFARKR